MDEGFLGIKYRRQDDVTNPRFWNLAKAARKCSQAMLSDSTSVAARHERDGCSRGSKVPSVELAESS